MDQIIIKPLGIIKTPYHEAKNIPIQGRFEENITGTCILNEEYTEGLHSLEGFSHAILIYYFHKAKEELVKAKPFLEDVEHGIFSIRSPYRPNKIGFSIVKIKSIESNKLHFTEVDILNDTPLIDIKPFVKHFDNRENTKSGWIKKHFINNKVPERIILKG